MKIRAIGSLADFEVANTLIDAMGKWDAEQSRRFGVKDSELMEYVYGDTPEKLMRKFSQRAAGFFLARLEDHAAGCAGYSKSSDGIAELQKMFVQPEARGRGVAKGLMSACLAAMRRDGYASVRLETVAFMSGAIAMYEAFGFKRSDPFRSVPTSLQPITIFMERAL